MTPTSRRPLLTWPALATTIAALALGTLGGASADAVVHKLTKQTVKKIATKVVTTQAATLTVQNAKRLGNRPAANYLTTGYQFTLPNGTASSSTLTFTLSGLAAGTYAVSYDILSQTNQLGGTLSCWLQTNSQTPMTQAFSYGTANPQGTYSSNIGYTMLNVGAQDPVLTCHGLGVTFTIVSAPNNASSVTFTRVDTQLSGTVH